MDGTRRFVQKYFWIAILAVEVTVLWLGCRWWYDERGSALDLTSAPTPVSFEPPPLHFPLQLNLSLRPKGLSAAELEAADDEFKKYLRTREFSRALERFGDDFSLRVWSGYWFQIPKLEVGAAKTTAQVSSTPPGDSEVQPRFRLVAKHVRTVPGFNVAIPTLVSVVDAEVSSEALSQLALNSYGALSAAPGDSQVRSRARFGTKYPSTPPGFNLPVPTLVSYADLRSALARQLVGRYVGATQGAQDALEIKDVTIYSGAEQCVVGVKVESIEEAPSRRGWLYFTATPSIEPSDQTLRLRALALTSPSPGVEPVPQTTVQALNDAIRNVALVDLRDIKGAALGRARQMLEDLVEPALVEAFEAPIWQLEGSRQPIASPVGLDGSLYYLTSHDIHAADQGLLVIWMASGWITVAFTPDETQARTLAEAAADARRREALRQQREAEMRERERQMRAIRESLRGLRI
jgi:hypothetical protein